MMARFDGFLVIRGETVLASQRDAARIARHFSAGKKTWAIIIVPALKVLFVTHKVGRA
jgi:hypothetical protein